MSTDKGTVTDINGDENDFARYKSPVRKMFNGYLSVVARTRENATGTTTVRVASDELVPITAETTVKVAAGGGRQG